MIVCTGLFGEQSGFLMTKAFGSRLMISRASIRLCATCAAGNATPCRLQSSRAKSRSRSINIASPVGENKSAGPLSSASVHGAFAQSMDIGTTRSIPCPSTSPGNESAEATSNAGPASVGESCP